MGTGELVKILGTFAGVTGGILSVITGFIAYKFRRDIKQGEKRRAIQKLRHIRPEPKSREPELTTTGPGHV